MHEHHDNVTQQLREMSAHLAGDTGDAVSRAAFALAHSAAELLEAAKKETATGVKKIGEEVREHPVTSTAIVAAAIGLIGFAVANNRQHTKR